MKQKAALSALAVRIFLILSVLIGIGMPYGIFTGVCDGIYRSANGVERDCRKAVLRANLKEAGLKDPGLVDGQAYYMMQK